MFLCISLFLCISMYMFVPGPHLFMFLCYLSFAFLCRPLSHFGGIWCEAGNSMHLWTDAAWLAEGDALHVRRTHDMFIHCLEIHDQEIGKGLLSPHLLDECLSIGEMLILVGWLWDRIVLCMFGTTLYALPWSCPNVHRASLLERSTVAGIPCWQCLLFYPNGFSAT